MFVHSKFLNNINLSQLPLINEPMEFFLGSGLEGADICVHPKRRDMARDELEDEEGERRVRMFTPCCACCMTPILQIVFRSNAQNMFLIYGIILWM